MEDQAVAMNNNIEYDLEMKNWVDTHKIKIDLRAYGICKQTDLLRLSEKELNQLFSCLKSNEQCLFTDILHFQREVATLRDINSPFTEEETGDWVYSYEFLWKNRPYENVELPNDFINTMKTQHETRAIVGALLHIAGLIFIGLEFSGAVLEPYVEFVVWAVVSFGLGLTAISVLAIGVLVKVVAQDRKSKVRNLMLSYFLWALDVSSDILVMLVGEHLFILFTQVTYFAGPTRKVVVGVMAVTNIYWLGSMLVNLVLVGRRFAARNNLGEHSLFD